MSDLVKQPLKPSGLSDWTKTLKDIWVGDSQRPDIYTSERTGNDWDGRYSVQERSR